jgi:hypothetical protein
MLFLPSSTSESSLYDALDVQRPIALSHTASVARPRYFTSRPDLLSRVGGSSPGQEYQETQPTAPSAVALPPAVSAAAQRALANPTASRMLTTGIQRAATTGGGVHGHAAAAVAPLAVASLPSLIGQTSSAGPRNNSAAAGNGDRNANANGPSAGLGAGRVAAAAQAFSSPKPAANPSNPNKPVAQKVSSARCLPSSQDSVYRSDWRGGLFIYFPYISLFFFFWLFVLSHYCWLSLLFADDLRGWSMVALRFGG